MQIFALRLICDCKVTHFSLITQSFYENYFLGRELGLGRLGRLGSLVKKTSENFVDLGNDINFAVRGEVTTSMPSVPFLYTVCCINHFLVMYTDDFFEFKVLPIV